MLWICYLIFHQDQGEGIWEGGAPSLIGAGLEGVDRWGRYYVRWRLFCGFISFTTNEYCHTIARFGAFHHI